jgi:hypothetical protein
MSNNQRYLLGYDQEEQHPDQYLNRQADERLGGSTTPRIIIMSPLKLPCSYEDLTNTQTRYLSDNKMCDYCNAQNNYCIDCQHIDALEYGQTCAVHPLTPIADPDKTFDTDKNTIRHRITNRLQTALSYFKTNGSK